MGHTKFSPDRFFGLFKKVFRRSTVCTIFDIARTVTLSTNTNQHVPQLIKDIDGTHQVKFYQWSAHLGQYFKNIPNILSYHNFSVSEAQIGRVNLRQHSTSEETHFSILKPNADLSAMKALPQLTPIPGLDLQRQWYLYDNIRQHCKSTLSADITCPKPTLPKPSARVADSLGSNGRGASVEPPAKRKRVITCSICQQTGHTKRTCSNKK